jgi:uncharacterized membrane-anchored protein
MVTKERNGLLERLKEFEIIADDLANLKRLQQENEQLKRSLAAQGGSVQVPKQEQTYDQNAVNDLFDNLDQSESQSNDNKELEDFLTAPTDAVEEVASAEEVLIEEPVEETLVEAAIEEPVVEAPPVAQAKSGTDKTPEDLLSEFEKMLG